ncbi:hypothetical protein RHGRI_008669 [Rhododendron griersonianum]|uniref:Wall-associated receptor kinase galacturonan-binding domain-containing protein n=1 Tax=Rhododendron griersonianum TaxID=479676 RepID=A0AAV6L158_9ERIC|nr:hypothetical protein RHGRI_008669 [Rhododendron griersonianum]
MALAPAGYKTPLLLVLILFSVTCSYGNQKQQSINSCGDNLNISFPFQLQGGPSNNTCNDYFYTLFCDENNRTVLPLSSGKYYVQSIDYTDHSIRLVDIGIQTNNICSSFPLSSFKGSDFWPVGLIADSSRSSVLFFSCEKPVQSPTYINRTRYCNTRDESGNGNYESYVVADGDDVRVQDIADSCVLEVSYISMSRLIRKRG